MTTFLLFVILAIIALVASQGLATHTITHIYQVSGETLTADKTYSASNRTDVVGETIAGNTTDRQISVAIDVSAVKSFFLLSDQAVTVETNSGSAPDDTITLKAGVPYVWNTDSYNSFLLTADVTALFVTNSGEQTATLQLRCIQDATP